MNQRSSDHFNEHENRIYLERARCHESFLYFCDNYCMIQDRKSGESIPFKLWPGQKEAILTILSSIYLIILKARQLGLTWLVAAYALWQTMFRFNQLALIISAKEDLAVEFLDRVKYIFDRLPDHLKPRVYKRTTTELTFGYETRDESGNVKIEGLNSTIKSSPSTPDAGQSKTISLLVLDESALNRYCREIWGSAKPTLEHAGGQTIIISNPSKIMPGWPWTRDLYTGSMQGKNEFKRVFLDWRCVPGRGDDFIKKQIAAGFEEDDISMQYPSTEEEAISILGGSYFGRTIRDFKPYPGVVGNLVQDQNGYRFQEDQRGILEIWDPPKAGHEFRYCIGSDVSEGLGNTYSAAYVYDRVNLCFVARLRSNKIEADIWAQRLIELATLYNQAMIGVERNGAGITTVNYLKGNYYNLFYRRRPGRLKDEYVNEYGWLETEENKQILADDLKRYFREIATRVPCAFLLDECSTFIRHENGRLAHEQGKLDDCVIAAGIALQVSAQLPAARDLTPRKESSPHAKRIDDLIAGRDPYRADADDLETWMSEQHGGNRPWWEHQAGPGQVVTGKPQKEVKVYHDLD